MNKSLRLIKANDGGYIVTDDAPDLGMTTRLLFAGDLSSALNYMSEVMRGVEPTPSSACGPA